MNTITIYTTTDDLVTKMSLIQQLSELNSVTQVEAFKTHYKSVNDYLTKKHSNRVAFNISFSTLSLLTIFIGGNLITD